MRRDNFSEPRHGEVQHSPTSMGPGDAEEGMLISLGIMWMVCADTAFLRKFARNNLCPLATILRHRCSQRVYNCGQKLCIAPPRYP
jgi:hypothetical protein